MCNKIYKNKGSTEDKKKVKCKEQLLQTINDLISGEENEGKAFISELK